MIKILIIEDDTTMVSLLKMLLGLEGYHVETLSSDTQDIVKLAQNEHPELILLDVHFGKQNGRDVIRRLKKVTELKNTKVIMTSGLDLGESCYTAGADDFILKPYMPDELLKKIKDFFPNNGYEKNTIQY